MFKHNQNPGIKSQLFTAQISLILISTISFFAISSTFLYKQNMNNAFRSIKHSGELALSQTNRIFTQLENTIYYVSVNTEIPSILASAKKTDHIDRQRNRNAINNTWAILQTSHTYPVDFTLYTNSDNQNIFFDNNTFCTTDSVKNEQWYNNLMNTNNKIIYHIQEKNGLKQLSIISKLYNGNDYSKIVGIFCISVSESVIQDILNPATTNELFTVLVDKNNTSISSLEDYSLSQNDISILSALKSTNTSRSVRLDNKCRYYAIASEPENQVFSLYTLYCVDSIYQTISTMLLILTLILIIVSIIAFLISWKKSLPFVNAFNNLSNAMRKMNLGDFKQLNIPEDTDDNIIETYSSYNHLMQTVTTLIKYNADYEMNLKKLELDFLQQQIKPHFLYNTLNTMQSLVKTNEHEKVLELINSLSKFYRLSLHNSNEAVEISSEINHIMHYVKIENFKFNNAVTLNIDLPENVMSCKVPKLILQPLIENAIHHGIREKATGTGTIKITHQQNGNDIFIYITDDGVGISPEKLETIKQGHSVGYTNTDRRIQLYFGEEYGLDIESIEGEYTKIIIKIPGGNSDD